MHKIKVAKDSNFDLNQARELLNLVIAAHDQYTRAKNDTSWDWENDLTTISANQQEYKVLRSARFCSVFLY